MTSSTPPILDAELPCGRELPLNMVLRGQGVPRALLSRLSSQVAACFVVL
jgi:hypothetical protein